MKSVGLIVAAVVAGLVIVVGLFLLSALLLQWLVNIVLAQYGIEQLHYTTAMAITALVAIYGTATRSNGSKE